MIRELRLGARLATTLAGGGRQRAVLTFIASAVGVAVILSILGIVAADRAVNAERYTDGGMGRVVTVIVVVVSLQVVGLVATAGRLSAALRTRRLANLRLLGLSTARTRVVAATEAGAASATGALTGVAAALLLRPVLGRISVAGQRWPTDAIDPGATPTALVAVGVAVATVVLAALPERLSARSALATTRRAKTKAPSLLRLVPLTVGMAICAVIRSNGLAERQIPWLLAGIALTGVGVILVVPVFVRLSASLLVRIGPGRAGLVAGRRLQAQPASVNRLITGLLLGLFLVTGARCVVVAFESTPQYELAAHQVEDEQTAYGWVDADEVDATLSQLRELPGVRAASAVPWLSNVCLQTPGSGDEPETLGQLCTGSVVASCVDVSALWPSAIGCHDHEVMLLTTDDDPTTVLPGPITIARANDADPSEPTVTLDYQGGGIEANRLDTNGEVTYIVPPDAAGVADVLAAGTTYRFIVRADPGRDLGERISVLGIDAFYPWVASDYSEVATLRAIVTGIALVVIGLGLLAFAIAAIDRATHRRDAAIALQLIGTGPRVLRRAQWIESTIPILAGSVLAIAAGALAGGAYLSFDDLPIPWRSVLLIAAVAASGGTIIAGLTVAAANPSISPNTIRRT